MVPLSVWLLLVERICAAVPIRRIYSHADVHVSTQVPFTGQSVPPHTQYTMCRRHDGRYELLINRIYSTGCAKKVLSPMLYYQ